jgi:hypothetical protein
MHMEKRYISTFWDGRVTVGCEIDSHLFEEKYITSIIDITDPANPLALGRDGVWAEALTPGKNGQPPMAIEMTKHVFGSLNIM